VNDPAHHTEMRRALSTALAELPEDYRAVVILRDVEGFSTAEVAETLGLSVANAKTRAHRARLFLRHRLTESLR
jgi:RNA polymerase sigma-70 factor (ECF subfamily)